MTMLKYAVQSKLRWAYDKHLRRHIKYKFQTHSKVMSWLLLLLLLLESGQNAFSGVTSVEGWWAWSEGRLINILSADDHRSLVCC